MTSVGSDFPMQMRRARKMIEGFRKLGEKGAPAVEIMEEALGRAEDAQASGDLIRVLRAYAELRGLCNLAESGYRDGRAATLHKDSETPGGA